MNLFLHWLRRDLHRHALLILLWALLVALFTWMRLHCRQKGFEYMANRDAMLIGSALVLGLVEIFLLLRILLDDPAGGTRTFWKTRPPTGGAVFAAKAVQVGLVSLAIPFAAEAVFLAVAGPSMDVTSRAVCILLPALFALMAGSCATNWHHAMGWLPAAFAVMLGALMAGRWLHQQQHIAIRPANFLFSTAVVLMAAGGLAWWRYQRRSAQWLSQCLAIALPAIAWPAVSSAGFGNWSVAGEVDASRLEVVAVGRPEGLHEFDAAGPRVSIKGLAVTGVTHAFLCTTDPVLRAADGREIKGSGPLPGLRFEPCAGQTEGVVMSPGIHWPADAVAAMNRMAFTITGTAVIIGARQHTLSIPMDGRLHEVSAGDARWRIVYPAPDRPDFYRRPVSYSERDRAGGWLELECFGAHEGLFYFPASGVSESKLRHSVTGETIPLMGLTIDPHAPLWQGAGFSWQRLTVQSMNPDEAAKAHARLEQIAAEAGPASPWVLDITLLVPAGKWDLPFSLTWPKP